MRAIRSLHAIQMQTVKIQCGRQVKDHVRANEWLETAPVGRVGVEDVAVGVLVEGAEARRLCAGEHLHGVVVGVSARPNRSCKIVEFRAVLSASPPTG